MSSTQNDRLGWAMRRPQSRVKVKTEGETCHMNYAMVECTFIACLVAPPYPKPVGI